MSTPVLFNRKLTQRSAVYRYRSLLVLFCLWRKVVHLLALVVYLVVKRSWIKGDYSCLFDCKEDMSVQLSNFHLSKSNLRDNELIAIRAEMFNLIEEQFKMMFICPSHRHNLGRFWRPLRDWS
jgi:hypothetical protein